MPASASELHSAIHSIDDAQPSSAIAAEYGEPARTELHARRPPRQNMVCVRYAHARPRVGDRVHCPEACDNAGGSAVCTCAAIMGRSLTRDG